MTTNPNSSKMTSNRVAEHADIDLKKNKAQPFKEHLSPAAFLSSHP